MNPVGRFIRQMRDFVSPARQDLERPREHGEYMRGNRTVTMGGWRPALREPWQDVLLAWKDSAARSTDLIHNVGRIAGAIEQATVDCVGDGLTLNAKPREDALQLDAARTAEWAKLAESRFRTWSNRAYDCDVEGRRTFGQMQAAQYKTWFSFGEMVAELPWRERPGSLYGTKVRLISPHRLSSRTEDMSRIIQGVRMDRDTLPISYIFNMPDQFLGTKEVELQARDLNGRNRVVHVFDGAVGHYRGISVMVPMLQVARQYDQLANAKLMQDIVRSIFALSVEGESPTDEILAGLLTEKEQAVMANADVSRYDAWFEMQNTWYQNKQIDVGVAGRVIHPFPGQEVKAVTSQSPGGDYDLFAKRLEREEARTLGILYEGYTGDYAGVTFSSMRVAIDFNWRIVVYRRKNVVAPFCQPVYEAWLEEEMLRGGPLAVPNSAELLAKNRAGVCNAEWTGSPKPVPNELQAVQADKIELELGIASEYDLAEKRGKNYDDVCAEREQAQKTRERHGLDRPILGNGYVQGQDPNDPNGDKKTSNTGKAAK